MDREVSPTDPIVVYMDGFGDHMTFEMIEYGFKHGIQVALRPPHTSHLTQTEDLLNFPVLKCKLRIEVLKLSAKLATTQDGLTWGLLMPCLARAYDEGFSTERNVKAWQVAGMSGLCKNNKF